MAVVFSTVIRPERSTRCIAMLAVCLMGVLGSAAVSVAAPSTETEPNENLFQINGPISADGVVGTLGWPTDVDEFLVMMQPARHVKLLFSLTNAGTPDCVLAPGGSLVLYRLSTEDAEPFVEGEIEVGNETVDVHDEMSTPGAEGDPPQALHLTFFAKGEEAAGCSYRFTVTDSGGHATDAIVPTGPPPPAAVAVAEPNDALEQAFGPLAGDTYYFGAIEADGDIDRLRAWLFPGQPVTVELAAVGGDIDATIADPLKNMLLPGLPTKSEQVHRATIVGTAAENLIEVHGAMSARWRLRLSPAQFVLPAAPAGSPPRAPRKRYKTGVTLRRAAGRAVRYSGKVSSAGAGCKSDRLVVLRHRGSGLKRFTITRTKPDGRFTLSRRTRPAGTVYAAVVEKASARRLCRFARSQRVGG